MSDKSSASTACESSVEHQHEAQEIIASSEGIINNDENDEPSRNGNNNNINSNNNNNDNNDDNNNKNDDANANMNNNEPPPPNFLLKQKVLARDTDTPLLYEALVRKRIYAPKSKKVHIGSATASSDDDVDSCLVIEDEDEMFPSESSKTWHYFVHYQGWNVKWDRWVEEESLFEDKESTRILAKRLKEESKILKKKNNSDKVVMKVMRSMRRMEKEFREREARGEPLEVDDIQKEEKPETGDESEAKSKAKTDITVATKSKSTAAKEEIDGLKKSTKNKAATTRFIQKEVNLRQRDLSSKKPSNAIKKVLTDEWEVISQCGMVHNIPATISVMDALNAYYEGKIHMLRNTVPSGDLVEEKKDDNINNTLSSSTSSSSSSPSEEVTRSIETTNNEGTLQPDNPVEQEWMDMKHGLALFFDHALPKQLLYRHELPQRIILDGKEGYENKRYCELYPCEHLLRLFLKLPELVEDAKDMTEEEKSKITYKIGDLVRFLQKHQSTYFLQRYRKPTSDESEKAKRLQYQLGFMSKNTTEPKDEQDGDNESRSEMEVEDLKRKRKSDGGKRKKKKKLAS
jgi:hypothetical protein